MRTHTVCRARARFPRGLVQPAGGFRFSADALLLASYAARSGPSGNSSLLDLGCGCGVVGLACLLALPGMTATGVDCLPEQVAAARENAVLLGLADRFAATEKDLDSAAERQTLASGGYALVVANMPYRAPGSGRLPREPARRTALFAKPSTMAAFLAAAKRALAPEGSLALVYPWETRDALLLCLERHGLAPVELLPVMTGRDAGSRILVRAAHAETAPAGNVPCSAPLLLYAKEGQGFTREALAFCPWLSRRASPDRSRSVNVK
ncbi:MAG: methyltransferase [Deltaproteobacteria bacterium]|nr:methyltransferase [Deltaproteobacteria bacterium]